MEGDVKALENSLRSEIKELRNEMKKQETIVSAKIDVVKADLAGLKWVLWVIGVFVLTSFVLFVGK